MIEFSSRRVDDAVGATAVHLVNGIWGQISVGLFADGPTGPKGLLLGGGTYQLTVQAISALCLTVWAATTTLIILFVVNKMTRIRLNPEDEKLGCDLAEHYLGKANGNELQKSMSTLDKIIHITTPIAQRLAGSTDDRNDRGQRENDDFGRRKPYHANQGFERD